MNLALTPYVIRTLGTVAFGLYLVTSTLGVFLGQFDGGVNRSAQRYFVLYAGTRDRESTTRLLTTLLVIITVTTCALFGLVFVAAPAIVSFFHTPPELRGDVLFLFRVLIIGVGVALGRNLFASILSGYQRFALTSITWILSYAINAVGMVFVLSRGMGLRGIAYAFIVQQLFATVTIIPSAMPYLCRAGVGLLPRAMLAEFFGFAWKVQISGLVNLVGQQGTILVVGRLAPLQVPYFGPGVTFAQQLRQLPVSSMRPVQSLVGRSLSGESVEAAVRQASEIQRAWVIFVSGWVAVGAPAAYFGINLWLPLDSRLPGVVAAAMLAAHLFALLPQVALVWAMLWRRPEYEMRAGVISLTVTLGLAIPTATAFGAVAVAASAVIGQGAAFAYLTVVTRRLPEPLPPVWTIIPWLPTALAAVGSAVTVGATARVLDLAGGPHGALGLLCCALAAGPVLCGYLVATFGLRRVRGWVTRRGRF